MINADDETCERCCDSLGILFLKVELQAKASLFQACTSTDEDKRANEDESFPPFGGPKLSRVTMHTYSRCPSKKGNVKTV